MSSGVIVMGHAVVNTALAAATSLTTLASGSGCGLPP